MKTLFALLFLLAFSVSCAGIELAYDGPRRGVGEVAELRTGGKARVLWIDGRRLGGRSYEILPGEHVARIEFKVLATELEHDGAERFWLHCDLSFLAEAGRVYRPKRTDLYTKTMKGDSRKLALDFDVFLQLGLGPARDNSAEFDCAFAQRSDI